MPGKNRKRRTGGDGRVCVRACMRAGERTSEEGRNEIPPPPGRVLQEGCALAPVHSLCCPPGSLSATSPLSAASNHQQEVLLHAGGGSSITLQVT